MLTFPSFPFFVNIPGTPATVTQLAKDVCTFLKWAAGERFFLFSHFREVKGVCQLPKNFGNFDGKYHRVKNVCNFTFVSLSLSFQNSRWQDRYCPELPGSGESFWKLESRTRNSTWKISNRRTRQRTRQKTDMKLDKKIRQEMKQRIGQIIRQEIGKNSDKKSHKKAGKKEGCPIHPIFLNTQ